MVILVLKEGVGVGDFILFWMERMKSKYLFFKYCW